MATIFLLVRYTRAMLHVQLSTHFDTAALLLLFGMLPAAPTRQNSIEKQQQHNKKYAGGTANNPRMRINLEIKRHQGAYKRLGWRRLLPIAAEELFGFSNRGTFDINSLSGTLLMARSAVV